MFNSLKGDQCDHFYSICKMDSNKKKQNRAPTKPNNDQNPQAQSAGTSTRSNSKKQQSSQGAGGGKEGKPEGKSNPDKLALRNRSRTSQPPNQDGLSKKLKSTPVRNGSKPVPNANDSDSDKLFSKERLVTSRASTQPENNVSGKPKTQPTKKPTESQT